MVLLFLLAFNFQAIFGSSAGVLQHRIVEGQKARTCETAR
jgi:hypothetical protein